MSGRLLAAEAAEQVLALGLGRLRGLRLGRGLRYGSRIGCDRARRGAAFPLGADCRAHLVPVRLF